MMTNELLIVKLLSWQHFAETKPLICAIPAKSLYRSHVGRHFYGTEYEIWAGCLDILLKCSRLTLKCKKVRDQTVH